MIKFSYMMIVTVFVIGVPVISTTRAVAAGTKATEAGVQSKDSQTSGAEGEPAAKEPDLADIIPLASKLHGRLVTLENGIAGLLDISEIENSHAKIEEDLKNPADQLEKLKDSQEYKYSKLVELGEVIRQKNELFKEISQPLRDAIRQLGKWRTEWLKEKKLWSQWQSSLQKDGDLDQLKPTFAKADDIIEKAHNLIRTELEAMLAVQEKAGNIQARIHTLIAELDSQFVKEWRVALIDKSPPMLSSAYFSQFRSADLWYAAQKGLSEISWPDSRFFARQGWIISILVLLSLFVSIVLYRSRRMLTESERWRFLAARPFSAGLFLISIAASLIYEYQGAPAIWKLANVIVVGVFFARLSGVIVESSWKRRFVYVVIIFFIASKLMDVLNFPLPLFRLYIFLAALLGLIFCLRWAGESVRRKDSDFYKWSLRLGALFFAVIMTAELWGKETLAGYLFVSLIHTIATIFAFMLFMYIIHGGVEWLFRISVLRRATILCGDDTDAIIRRVSRFINVALWGLVLLPAVLAIWGFYGTLGGATKSLLALGFNLGSQRISVGLVLTSAGVLYGSFLASWIVQKLLMAEVIIKRQVQRGVRHSIAKLIHYIVIFIGFLFALSVLGFDVTKLTILVSAFGIGIGFGLQSIVNNFVCGLILLFERPVRVGDIIELAGKWAEIKKIGLRSTTIQTFEQADVIIPNADLVTGQVTNWTLSNRQVRITIPVGVAYGSDIPLVMETLVACANTNSKITKTPEPQVLFLNFGESTLDFELRVWVLDAEYRLKVKSELNQEIERRFREANIKIAFPQRDLHLRSLDDSIIFRQSKTT